MNLYASFSKTLVAAAILACPSLLTFPARAQWQDYPAGPKPAMDGPTPRTADGHPDLSGVWENGRPGGQGRGAGPAANPGAPNGRALPPVQNGPPPDPTAARPVPPLPADGIPLATFQNIGAGLKDGLPLRPWAADLLKKRMADNDKDNPDAHCLPLGLMQLHMHVQPRKIIQTPTNVVILYEAQGGVRQIFTDGRTLPGNDPEPWWYGYSIGHWEGDTLVVETTGFRDDVWLDINGSPMTNTGKMIERFSRPNFGSLTIEVTIDDPKVYTKPFTVRVNQRLMPNTELIEFVCNENERSDSHLVGAEWKK